MTRMWSCALALGLSAIVCATAQAQVDVTTGYTSVAAAQYDSFGGSNLLLPMVVGTQYPAGESPIQALDDNTGTKYLSFPGAGLNGAGVQVSNPTGFVVVLGTPSAINGVQFTTANDFASRDPGSVSIYGINVAGTASSLISAITNPSQLSLVYSGSTGIPQFASTADGRFTLTPAQSFATSAVYSAYAVIITDLVRYPANAPTNFQFSEVSLLYTAVPEPSSVALCGLAGVAVVGFVRRKK